MASLVASLLTPGWFSGSSEVCVDLGKKLTSDCTAPDNLLVFGAKSISLG